MFCGVSTRALGALLAVLSAACAGPTAVQTSPQGAEPVLPAPSPSWMPTVHVAPAVGWSGGGHPLPASGLQVAPFADGLDHPRWLYVLPNGDVLVAETNAPPRPDDGRGVVGWVMRQLMAKAGARTPSADRITLLRDTDGDGVADTRSVFVGGLHSPFGMALVGENFYVANTDAVLRFRYVANADHVEGAGVKLVELPGGNLNHHWTKNLIANADGSRLYVTVGSNSNVAEHGMEVEQERAAIWEVDAHSGAHRLYASGLRNPNGMSWDDGGKVLWTVVNERDALGDDLVPDYLTSVRDGGFYGWPYCYYRTHVDERVKPPRPDLVAKALAPDYALGAHVAALGLVAARGTSLPAPYREGMFIGEHGSWNRHAFSGYRVVLVPFRDGRPAGDIIEVLGGFLSPKGEAQGRPVGVALDRSGALLVADDVGNTIWRVTAARALAAARP